MKVELDSDFDFGFSAVSEDELKALERDLEKQLEQKSQTLQTVETTYQGKLEQLYKTIMPLLRNLAKNPEKEYIFWPNRTEKMAEFIKKVDSIVND